MPVDSFFSQAGSANQTQHMPADAPNKPENSTKSQGAEKFLSEKELLEWQVERQSASKEENAKEEQEMSTQQHEDAKKSIDGRKTGEEVETNSTATGVMTFVKEERSMSFE